jgi:hypothetical protein
MLSHESILGSSISSGNVSSVGPQFLGTSMDFQKLQYGKYNPDVLAFGGTHQKTNTGMSMAVGLALVVGIVFFWNKF